MRTRPANRRLIFLALLAPLTLVLASLTPSGASAAPPEAKGLVPLCFAATTDTDHERTLRVPRAAVPPLLEHTASYRGHCAEYGESADQGQGTATAYTQTDRKGVPQSVGMVFDDEALQDLPHDPPSDGTYCFDKDGDGSVDPMHECSNGYESELAFGDGFTSSVDTPISYLLLNWNPMGHMPPDVYDKPHFDVHFYLTEPEQRQEIRVGACGELVHCDDYPLGKKLPEAKYYPSQFKDTDAVAPAMGNHLINTDAPEFHGEPFTHTWIFGSWDSEITFYEPMITHDWYAELAADERKNECFDIPRPDAVAESGWYPTEYCTRHRENRGELTTSLEEFEYRQAS